VLGEGASGTERVPLKETSADVSIAGVIARVQGAPAVREQRPGPDRGGVRVPGVDLAPPSTACA
jgi:hypothetical protein